MMNFSFTKSGDTGHLIFDGDIMMQSADEVREALMISIANSESLVVDIRAASSLDLICLRLFCFAYKLARRSNKRFILIGLSSQLSESLHCTSVLSGRVNCILDSNKNCIWKGWEDNAQEKHACSWLAPQMPEDIFMRNIGCLA